MLVVADSSPINILVRIGHVDMLPQLFHSVAIPIDVANELSHRRTPQSVKDFIAKAPAWLTIRQPTKIEAIIKLDPGERAAISLASELHADFVLIDEQAGRRAALERKLQVIGTIGILERAADQHMIDLEAAFDLIRKTDFRVSDDLMDAALKRRQK